MSGPAPASSGSLQATASLSPATASVGDRIELTVSVLHAGADAASPPTRAEGEARLPLRVGDKLGGIEVVEVAAPVVHASPDGSRETRFAYRLTSFEVGSHELPELEVRAGGAAATVPPQRLEVASVLPQMSADEIQAAEIRDIKGPATILPDYTTWAVVGLGIAALLLALLLLRRYLRRPRRAAAPSLPLLPPYEEAIAALAALEGKRLHERGAFRELGFELSEIFRRYLSRRFQIQALEATTREVMRELAESREAASLRHKGAAASAIHGLLEETDLLKYAKHVPAASVGAQLLVEARRLVELTREDRQAAGARVEAAA